MINTLSSNIIHLRRSSKGLSVAFALALTLVLAALMPIQASAQEPTREEIIQNQQAVRGAVQSADRSTQELFKNFARLINAPATDQPVLPDFTDLAALKKDTNSITTASNSDTRLDVLVISIADASAEALEVISGTLNAHQGSNMSIGDLVQLANTLTRDLRVAGFFLSRVILPPQEITQGSVEYRMLGGHISNIVIEGVPDGLLPGIRKTLDPLMRSPVLKLSNLERQLLLVREMYGISVQPVLRADPKGEVGGAELVIKVAYDRSDIFVVAHNEGSEYYNRGRVQVGGFLSLPWGYGGRVGLTVSGDEEFSGERSSVFSFSQIFGQGLRLDLTTNNASNELRSSNGGLSLPLENSSQYLALELSYPIIKRRRSSYRLAVGIHGNNFESKITPQNTGAGYTIHDTNRRSFYISMLGDSYYRGSKFNAFTTMSYELVSGLDSGLGASKYGTDQQYLLLRPDAAADFLKLAIDWSSLYWFDSGWRVRWSIAAQASRDALPASDEISFGGTRFGRGYDSGEASGDLGGVASLEVGHNWGSRTFLYMFADQSWIRNRQGKNGTAELASDYKEFRLSSAGFGARFNLGEYNNGNIDVYVAKPDSVVGSANKKSWRSYVRLSFNF